VRDYLPGFRVQDEAASRSATVRTLLTHMGGWEGDLFDDPGDGDDALARMVERMAALQQVAPFNTFWSYNNAGFYAAGRLIEVATGKSYEQAVQELLLAPLGLRHTYLRLADVMTHRFAVGHGGPPSRLVVLRPWELPRGVRPAGGVITTVGDLLRFAHFHLGDGAVPGGPRLLSPESLRQMQTAQLVKQGKDEEMALTWNTAEEGGVRRLWHAGSTFGQQALLVLVPSRRLAFALVTNSLHGEGLADEVEKAVFREYLGVDLADPAPIAMAERRLDEVVGRYSRPFMDVVVTRGGDRLLIQTILKQGSPTPTSPVPLPAPPVSYAFHAPDRLIAVAGPLQGARAEILRRSDGAVGWIRVSGRLARRISPAGGSGRPGP
jgi:CubicO group peptidase (beta-lactamase class C family)